MTSRREVLIGLDLGTTAVKALALDPGGAVLGVESTPTPTTRGPDGHAEHDVDALKVAVNRTLSRLMDRGDWQPLGVAATSMGEAGVPIDGGGTALHPIIAWLDQRTGAQTRRLHERVGAERLYALVGHPPDRHWGIPKLMWLRDERPEVYSRTRSWLSVADLAVLWLSGTVATDYSLASRTMAFDQVVPRWCGEVLEAASVPIGLLPEASPSGTVVGAVTAEAARLSGLPAGTPVVLGGHDRACGAFAARGGGECAIDSAGTAETIVVSVPAQSMRDAAIRYGIAHYWDVVPGRQLLSARVGLAGGLVEWARRQLFADAGGTYEALFAELPCEPGFTGVVCYPTFGRWIAPDWGAAEARGAFVGLTTSHTRTDLLQAILEATCFSLRANIDSIEQVADAGLGRLRAEGGVVRNERWMQLKADITGRELESVSLPDVTAVGAALLAGVGAGCYGDAAAAAASLELSTDHWIPRAAHAVTYRRVYETVYRPMAAAMLELSKVYDDA